MTSDEIRSAAKSMMDGSLADRKNVIGDLGYDDMVAVRTMLDRTRWVHEDKAEAAKSASDSMSDTIAGMFKDNGVTEEEYGGAQLKLMRNCIVDISEEKRDELLVIMRTIKNGTKCNFGKEDDIVRVLRDAGRDDLVIEVVNESTLKAHLKKALERTERTPAEFDGIASAELKPTVQSRRAMSTEQEGDIV